MCHEENPGTSHEVYIIHDLLCLYCGYESVGIAPVKGAQGFLCTMCGAQDPEFEWIPLSSGPDMRVRDPDELELIKAVAVLRRDILGK